MYAILIVCSFVFFSASASAGLDPITKEVNVSVIIEKESHSSELSIEGDSTSYFASYDANSQSFSNLDIGFTISSPMSTDDYVIELMESEHLCNGSPLTVETLLDDASFGVEDVSPSMSFESGLSTRHHKFTLVFPELTQIASQQECSGSLNVFARLAI
ncbi:hypothetical protein Sps_03969 [Shewanella psychrophila]|uniref:CS1 type fimbrial major subunit n=1 Tax=Shewanella psychrophila TaxID=225848 RepID=A0A1S6HUB2_9GAMM|nr:hypothetical protein [Shewanella psychrophila]AQS39084.1 hypothetical protein Sps_03969 [Shewanella psychrophila]